MKLTDKAKKRLILAGLGVVCVALVIAIVFQFKKEEPKDALVQPSSTVSDTVSPSVGIPMTTIAPVKTQEVTVPPISPAEVSSKSIDTGDSTGIQQSIQAEVTKPTQPPLEVKTDPTKTPDGEKVDSVKPVEHDKVTKPEATVKPEPSSPKAGDKNSKGQVWFPGFGWVDDEGANTGTKVGNENDELTGKKVGDMD